RNMRRLFTTQEALAGGLTPSQLRWGEATGRWRRVHKGVYGEGPDEPSELDRRVAEVVARGAVVSGRLAGVLHGLDGVDIVDLDARPPRRRSLPLDRIVGLPDPMRQVEVGWARVDLAWPELGLFVELDGGQHTTSRCTTPAGRLPSSPAPAGCAAGSPGPRSSACRRRRPGDSRPWRIKPAAGHRGHLMQR
ncbi:MAG: hypothetical protein QOD63_2860, partial [Actinomycetota bacterium]|nr:hypothetical protein [Actinomycetota bacterium]